MTDIPRQTALMVLNAMSRKAPPPLDHIITELVDAPDRRLSGQDRKFINNLIFGVMRWREFLDWIVRQHSRTRLEKIDTPVLNILRLGLYQIFFLNRVPDSAAVNTSVNLTKQTAPPWVVKYVNAVLRNAVRDKSHIRYPLVQDHPAEAVSVSLSFPRWLAERWIKRFGIEECKTLCHAFNFIPPITLRCNTLKLPRKELFQILQPEVAEIDFTCFSPDGLRLNSPKKPIQSMAAFKDGLFQVQDEAAQLAVYLLGPEPGEKILDACAGLGGKTGHIAQLMKNRGEIIAADRNSEKLARLKDVMPRLGVKIVEICPHDFNLPAREFQHREFDRILIDAPCSGTGVIRRNPDTKWNVTPESLKQCAKNQLKLLSTISLFLKPGGILAYVVCSVEPEENEAVIGQFLKKNIHFTIQQQFLHLPFDIKKFMGSDGFFRSFPHLHDMDGFFAVCLKRLQ